MGSWSVMVHKHWCKQLALDWWPLFLEHCFFTPTEKNEISEDKCIRYILIKTEWTQVTLLLSQRHNQKLQNIFSQQQFTYPKNLTFLFFISWIFHFYPIFDQFFNIRPQSISLRSSLDTNLLQKQCSSWVYLSRWRLEKRKRERNNSNT